MFTKSIGYWRTTKNAMTDFPVTNFIFILFIKIGSNSIIIRPCDTRHQIPKKTLLNIWHLAYEINWNFEKKPNECIKVQIISVNFTKDEALKPYRTTEIHFYIWLNNVGYEISFFLPRVAGKIQEFYYGPIEHNTS